ncbi:hypothetical protein KAK06_20260 [Ideonella sp. 4Y11]|uniref:Uncharacterized protein n=1 Tax=Ideonella aquatica TaxID=2824119 RepID=A0A941BHW1_9BURK|nr:hypothetical protein [Ideonella aquatica]MBQ0961301.1 hypothetical protein [Ideonella aquatica]
MLGSVGAEAAKDSRADGRLGIGSVASGTEQAAVAKDDSALEQKQGMGRGLDDWAAQRRPCRRRDVRARPPRTAAAMPRHPRIRRCRLALVDGMLDPAAMPVGTGLAAPASRLTKDLSP